MKLNFKTLAILFLMTGLFACGDSKISDEQFAEIYKKLSAAGEKLQEALKKDDLTEAKEHLGVLKNLCKKFDDQDDDATWAVKGKKISAKDIKNKCKEINNKSEQDIKQLYLATEKKSNDALKAKAKVKARLEKNLQIVKRKLQELEELYQDPNASDYYKDNIKKLIDDYKKMIHEMSSHGDLSSP